MLKTRDRWFEPRNCDVCDKKSDYGELIVLSYKNNLFGIRTQYLCPKCFKEVTNVCLITK